MVESFAKVHYCSVRGKKCKVTGKYMLFMSLTVLKHGGQWDVLGRIFKLKGLAFEMMITKYVLLVPSLLYKLLVTDVKFELKIYELVQSDQRFHNFRCPLGGRCHFPTIVPTKRSNYRRKIILQRKS